MTAALTVVGTDTGIGKTVFSAALVGALQAHYWKPVQSGLEDETDSETVKRLADIHPSRVLPEAYRLVTPASPHYAAEIDGVEIDAARLDVPRVSGPLVIETAGGLLVPLTRKVLQIDVIARWKTPVVLVSSTRLGTINHSLLSIEALKHRSIPILGIAFMGEEAAESMRAISQFGGVKVLGRLPRIEPLNSSTLRGAFAANFNVGEILGLGEGGP